MEEGGEAGLGCKEGLEEGGGAGCAQLHAAMEAREEGLDGAYAAGEKGGGAGSRADQWEP